MSKTGKQAYLYPHEQPEILLPGWRGGGMAQYKFFTVTQISASYPYIESDEARDLCAAQHRQSTGGNALQEDPTPSPSNSNYPHPIRQSSLHFQQSECINVHYWIQQPPNSHTEQQTSVSVK
jgi:hypothetical protein